MSILVVVAWCLLLMLLLFRVGPLENCVCLGMKRESERNEWLVCLCVSVRETKKVQNEGRTERWQKMEPPS